jgi:hypothetical protein
MAHVTIPDQNTYVIYPVTSSTTGPFTVPFAVFAKADITIMKDGVELGQAAFAYTPTSSTTGGYQTGTVSLSSAVENCEITIFRSILPVRTSDMGPGPKDRDADNTQWDRFQAQLQDLRRDMASSVGLAPGESFPRLPRKSELALKALVFDANGNPVAGSFAAPAISIASGWNAPLGSQLSVGAALLAGANNVFMPEQFGACGPDIDCQEFVQDAIDAAEEAGGTALLSQLYGLASGVVVDEDACAIVGRGLHTGLVGMGTASFDMLTVQGGGGNDIARSVAANAAEGARTVQLSTVSGLSTGQPLYFTVTKLGVVHEWITHIYSINSGAVTVTLAHPLPIGIDTSDTHQVTRVALLARNTLRNFACYKGSNSGANTRGVYTIWTHNTVARDIYHHGLPGGGTFLRGTCLRASGLVGEYCSSSGYPTWDIRSQMAPTIESMDALFSVFGENITTTYFGSIQHAGADHSTGRGVKVQSSRHNHFGSVRGLNCSLTPVALAFGVCNNHFDFVQAWGGLNTGNAVGIWLSQDASTAGNCDNTFARTHCRNNVDYDIQLNTNDERNLFLAHDGDGTTLDTAGTNTINVLGSGRLSLENFQIAETTTAALENIASGPNTTGKYEGRILRNATTKRYVQADGALAGAVWKSLADGSTTVHTPV